MRLQFILASAAVLGFLGSARANTISVFNLSGSTSSGTLSGTVTLDVTTGKFTNSAIRFLYSGLTIGGLLTGSTYNFTGAPVGTTTTTGYSSNDFAGTGNALLFDFDLTLPGASLVGYTGGSICSTARACTGQVSAVELLGSGLDYSQVASGTLTPVPSPVGVTPEPPALVLLGTGVLALGALLRKRSR